MFSGSIIVTAILVAFPFQGILAHNSSSNATETSANTATINPTTTMMLTSSTSVPVQPVQSMQTCVSIVAELQTPWQQSYSGSSSDLHVELINSLKGSFSDSSKYSDLSISVLILIQKGEGVILNATLCVVVKSDSAGFIEDKVTKDGKIGNTTVVAGSLKVTALGVEFSDFKAKDGECDKCSGGGAGPIVLEENCKPTTHSCNGVKPATKETDDCVTYCDQSSAVAMSTSILAVGVLLSFSFSFWG